VGLSGVWCVACFVGRRHILIHTVPRSLSCLSLDTFGLGGVWYLLCQGDLQVGGRDMLITLDVYLLSSSGILLKRTARVGVELSLRYCPSPGFHQKVGIRSLRGRVSFLVRVLIQSRIPLVLASIELVYDSISVLP
jgi:hypothetical protein